MRQFRRFALATLLLLGICAFAAYSPGAFGAAQFADTSGQPNEWDVGHSLSFDAGAPQLADTSGQPNEWDVGHSLSFGAGALQLADTSGQPNEWDVG